MRVSSLKADDIPVLIDLCRMQVEETLPHMPFEPDVVQHYGSWIASQDDPHIRVWIAWENAQAVGYLVGVRAPYLFCRGHSVSQEVVYVIPDKRGTRAAFRLMKELDRWAEQQNALEVYGGVANGFNPQRTATFMNKALGFQEVGVYMRKIPNADAH